jgi:hypothetical protein
VLLTIETGQGITNVALALCNGQGRCRVKPPTQQYNSPSIHQVATPLFSLFSLSYKKDK